MKVLLCCIIKMENHYLEEWTRHYFNLGIDKLVIYDNNDTSGKYEEHIEDIEYIKQKIDEGQIDVYKIPNETSVQVKYYNECYKKYSDYDWLMFFDIDEFLMLEKVNNIKEFLSQKIFNNYKIIHINWKTFTDNNLINVENEDYSLVNRFTEPCKDVLGISKTVDREIKSIVRGNIDKLEFTKNPHTLDSIDVPCCNAIGNIETNKKQKSRSIIHNGAWLNHYICKTIEEYCKIKLIRLGGHTSHKNNLRYTKSFFFLYNKKTPAKIKEFEKYFGSQKIHISQYLPVNKKIISKSFINTNMYSGNVKKIKIANSNLTK